MAASAKAKEQNQVMKGIGNIFRKSQSYLDHFKLEQFICIICHNIPFIIQELLATMTTIGGWSKTGSVERLLHQCTSYAHHHVCNKTVKKINDKF